MKWLLVLMAGLVLTASADPNHRDALGCTPLNDAAEVGAVAVTQLLLGRKVDVENQTSQGQTAAGGASMVIARVK